MSTSYQSHLKYTIASHWSEDDDLLGLEVAENSQLWRCSAGDGKTPTGMDDLVFKKLLRDAFTINTCALNIKRLDQSLKIDCNHSADGLTFILASFRLDPAQNALSFYQDATMHLIEKSNQKRVSLNVLFKGNPNFNRSKTESNSIVKSGIRKGDQGFNRGKYEKISCLYNTLQAHCKCQKEKN